jgi:hypothetical protein
MGISDKSQNLEKDMKNRILIVLVCSLVGNVGLLSLSQHWKAEYQRLKEVAVEEYNYAKTETEKKYILRPEYGMKLLDDTNSFELYVNSRYWSHRESPELGDCYGNRIGHVGTIDTSNFYYTHKARYTPAEMPVSQKILLLFCLQIIEQGNFFYGDFSSCGDNAAIGYLQNPAGAVVLVVAEHSKDRYCVGTAMQIHSSVQQCGSTGGPDLFNLPRSDFSFFTPTYIKNLRANRAARRRFGQE